MAEVNKTPIIITIYERAYADTIEIHCCKWVESSHGIMLVVDDVKTWYPRHAIEKIIYSPAPQQEGESDGS